MSKSNDSERGLRAVAHGISLASVAAIPIGAIEVFAHLIPHLGTDINQLSTKALEVAHLQAEGDAARWIAGAALMVLVMVGATTLHYLQASKSPVESEQVDYPNNTSPIQPTTSDVSPNLGQPNPAVPNKVQSVPRKRKNKKGR